jgi:hypothetical protein
MRAGIIEIVGLFLIVAGACGMVGAASIVSVALAVLVASAFTLLGGIIAVYVSAQLAKVDAAAKRPAASQ